MNEGGDTRAVSARLYFLWAAALLLLTLLAGVYLRAAFAWPSVRGAVNGAYAIHARSHVGFFGWAVLAAFALVVGRTAVSSTGARLHWLLAHAIGIGSVAAFVGFALRGYDTVTIAISALHVALWILFVAAVWHRLEPGSATTRRFLRAGLAFLAVAGLATTAPVLLMVRGVLDPWLLQLGVKLFLTPFVMGFLMLTAFGVVYERVPRPRHAAAVLALTALGVLPSTLLHVAAAPPATWLIWTGRAGVAVVAAGMLLFAVDIVRERLSPLVRLVVVSVAATAVLKLLAAAGAGASFMHSRAITVAFLHLIVLGIVTPAFVQGLRPSLRAPRRTATYAAGLYLMLTTLVVLGWPWAARLLLLQGMPLGRLLGLAAVGGAVSAVALLTLVVPGVARPARSSHGAAPVERRRRHARAPRPSGPVLSGPDSETVEPDPPDAAHPRPRATHYSCVMETRFIE